MILLAVLVACAFLLILFITQLFSKRNERLLAQIETGYVPAMEITQKLEDIFATIQRNLQYAVSAADEDMFEVTDSLRDSFLSLLRRGKSNPVLNIEDLDFLEKEFHEYYPLAREISQKMIGGEMGEEVIASLESMQEKYNAIYEKLRLATAHEKKNLEDVIASARRNQQTSMIMSMAIIRFGELCVFRMKTMKMSGMCIESYNVLRRSAHASSFVCVRFFFNKEFVLTDMWD